MSRRRSSAENRARKQKRQYETSEMHEEPRNEVICDNCKRPFWTTRACGFELPTELVTLFGLNVCTMCALSEVTRSQLQFQMIARKLAASDCERGSDDRTKCKCMPCLSARVVIRFESINDYRAVSPKVRGRLRAAHEHHETFHTRGD